MRSGFSLILSPLSSLFASRHDADRSSRVGARESAVDAEMAESGVEWIRSSSSFGASRRVSFRGGGGGSVVRCGLRLVLSVRGHGRVKLPADKIMMSDRARVEASGEVDGPEPFGEVLHPMRLSGDERGLVERENEGAGIGDCGRDGLAGLARCWRGGPVSPWDAARERGAAYLAPPSN